MTKTLQKKFIITAMVAITVLIVMILGITNLANAVIVSSDMERTLRIIADNDGDPRNMPYPPDAARPAHIQPKNDRDRLIGSNFFVVRFDPEGSADYVNVSRTAAVSEETAVELARTAYDSGEPQGRMGKFRYCLRDSRLGLGKTAVFLDTSAEMLSYLRVLILSAGVGLVCWVLMLLLVVALSRKAIRPIAENMEKQRQFVTDAGHELKTPLAIIQANAEALELYNGQSKWSRNIQEQTRRLDGLMKNLLLQARMDEGIAPGAVTVFSFSELVRESLQAFSAPAALGGITMKTAINEGIALRADREQIGQLVSILLDNAVKYTGQNGQVCVELTRAEQKTVLTVENTCPVLPDVPPEKLFDRFYRADSARTQKTGGYGIGLSVARSICAANRAQIEASYTAPTGIAFTVRFAGDA